MDGLDPSIYQNAYNPQPITPIDPVGSAQKAYGLADMALQHNQMQQQIQGQQLSRWALAKNTDPTTGKLDQDGALADINKHNPTLGLAMGNQFSAANKAQAEAQSAQLDTQTKTLNFTGPAFEHMAGMPEAQRAAAYPQVVQQLKDQGVDTSKLDHPYDPTLFSQYYDTWSKTKDALANHLTQSEIAKNQSETAMAPAKLNAEVYGSRSPNAELSSQYNADVKTVKTSQLAMDQMLDSYKNKTPQGDASLVLQNFRIRNPGVPDVNSIDEMKKSQAFTDQWKNKLTEAQSGGFDDNTRDNLIRDGMSAFRANYGSYQGIKDRYNARAQQQNVKDPTLTYEPAIEKTNAAVSKLSDSLGPYVPPSERAGGYLGAAKVMLGLGGSKTAEAAAPDARDAQAVEALKKMDKTSPQAFQLRSILKSKGLIQ